MRGTPQRSRQPAVGSPWLRNGEAGGLRWGVWGIWSGGGGGGGLGTGGETAAAAGGSWGGVEVVGWRLAAAAGGRDQVRWTVFVVIFVVVVMAMVIVVAVVMVLFGCWGSCTTSLHVGGCMIDRQSVRGVLVRLRRMLRVITSCLAFHYRDAHCFAWFA